MTGRAEGKFELEGARVYLLSKNQEKELKNASVYIHLKGYALARVTHLDVEHDVLNKIIPPKKGIFLSIHGIKDGIMIKLEKEKVGCAGKKLVFYAVKIFHPYLSKVLRQDERTRTWVGGKVGGIYIGFRKKQIEKLEEIVQTKLKDLVF